MRGTAVPAPTQNSGPAHLLSMQCRDAWLQVGRAKANRSVLPRSDQVGTPYTAASTPRGSLALQHLSLSKAGGHCILLCACLDSPP